MQSEVDNLSQEDQVVPLVKNDDGVRERGEQNDMHVAKGSSVVTEGGTPDPWSIQLGVESARLRIEVAKLKVWLMEHAIRTGNSSARTTPYGRF
ncbi:hypothetical protein ACOMHN_044645 [Nucella lapillus]